MIPGLDKLIDAILGTATSQLQDRIQRSEAVIKLLKRLNLDPDHPPADFSFIYQYALVEYGVSKPKPVLDLFRRPEIQQTFRQAFEQNNFPLLEKVSHEVIEANQFGNEIQQLGIDWRRELVAFSAVFIGVAKRSRTPAEVLRDQQVRSLHQHLFALQERLDRLPTIEGIRTEMARLAGEEVLALPAAEQGNHWAQQCRAYALSQQMRGWFETLGFRFEAYEVWQADYFEWIINVPVRRGRYDRILVRGMDGEAGLPDVAALRQSVEQQRTDEGWLVTARRISRAARNEVEKEEDLGCYTLDELLDQDADFTGYLDWLEQEIERRKIDQTYVPLACTKEEFDPVTRQRIGVSRYDDRDGWIDGYVDLWLDDPAKEHISVLGEFGTGKTWFALHYAWQALRRYREAQQRGIERPRLPLVIPLRDYAKAVSVESLFSEFFFRKHEVRSLTYSAFEQLNHMGKLLLIFDGFDEMAARVDRQEMINNFWELAKVVVPGAKVILTCRTEHFPEAKEGRALLNAELQASTKSLTGETPQFEVLELEKFNDDQIQQVLSLQAQPATVEQVMGNPQLLDLARRPVMTELILEALPDIEAGKPIDMSRIYLYAVRRKMERDIKAERTFTSMAEKLYFLCELSWEMLSTDRMSINYREFPDRIRSLFGATVQEEKDLDHWHYDMMGQTMLIRNAAGDYTPAHRSLLEFFVAYKFAAELGSLAPDFLELAQMQSCLNNNMEPQDYTWSNYFCCEMSENNKDIAISPLNDFISESVEILYKTVGYAPLTKAVLDFLVPLSIPFSQQSTHPLIKVIQATQSKTEETIGYVSGNAATLLVKLEKAALEGADLSHTIIRGADFTNASLKDVNFTRANLANSVFAKILGSVLSVAFSPNGEILATGDASGDIHLWRVANSEKLATLKGHTNWVWAVIFSPDGHTLASGSSDRSIKLWRISTGKCFTTIQDTNQIWSLAFSPDSRVLASAGSDCAIKLWQINTGKCCNILQGQKGHTSWIRSITFDSDGQTLASASEDQTVKIWKISTGECFNTCSDHTGSVWSVAFNSDGQILASGSEDQTIRIWQVSTGKCIKVIQAHKNIVSSVAFSSNSQLLASSSEDRTVKIWRISTGECLHVLLGHMSLVRSTIFSPNDQILASGGDDQTVRLWKVDTGNCLTTLQGSANSILTVAFSPDGQTVVGGSTDGTVSYWQVNTGKRIGILRGHTGAVISVALNSDSQIVASSGVDQTIRLWQIDANQCTKVLCKHTNAVFSVAFSPNGQILASAGGRGDQTIRLWNVNTGQCLQVLQGHTGTIWSIAFSPNGQLLASASEDQTIRFWEIDTGRYLCAFEEHSNWVRSVAFSPDGQILASGSRDQTIKLWQVSTGHCFETLHGHEDSVTSIAFSSNGQMLASASEDQTVRLWRVDTGQCLKVLDKHSNWVRSVTFSPNSQMLASSSEDGTIKLWNADTGNCVRTIQDRYPYEGMNITGIKGLTEAEKTTLKALGAIEN